MARQTSFFVYAAVKAGREDALRLLLARLNGAPGFADPANPILPFARFEQLHVARLVVIDDPTLDDRRLYPGAQDDPPVALAFMGFCDGPAGAMLAELAREAPRLREIFVHCVGFDEETDLLAWMRAHSRRSASDYINWRGRTMRQVREEAALCGVLRERLLASWSPGDDALTTAEALRRAVAVSLTPLEAPSPAERMREAAHFLLLPLAALLLLPALVVLAIPLALVLRRKEKRDPVVAERPTAARVAELSRFEDHGVTNPFTAVGSLKPGPFRRVITGVILWVLAWTTRHLYARGRLARVGTIHFARWVYIDGGRRLLFASNYDGSLESYMDDFINKAGFGLNLVFSNGIGYPRTDWLILGGASREPEFKAFLRRHQLPTDVWYKAARGLTTYDLARHARIRRGYEAGFAREEAAARWLAEIAA